MGYFARVLRGGGVLYFSFGFEAARPPFHGVWVKALRVDVQPPLQALPITFCSGRPNATVQDPPFTVHGTAARLDAGRNLAGEGPRPTHCSCVQCNCLCVGRVGFASLTLFANAARCEAV